MSIVKIEDACNVSREVRDQVIASFRNGTPHKFHNISSEMYRVYVYPDGREKKISGPLLLNTNNVSGGHRLFDVTGKSRYIRGGWDEIYWEVYDGEDHFSK